MCSTMNLVVLDLDYVFMPLICEVKCYMILWLANYCLAAYFSWFSCIYIGLRIYVYLLMFSYWMPPFPKYGRPRVPVNPTCMGSGTKLNSWRVMDFLTGVYCICGHGFGQSKPNGVVPIANPMSNEPLGGCYDSPKFPMASFMTLGIQTSMTPYIWWVEFLCNPSPTNNLRLV
jgi:hypothetical protein